ncbi:MAG: ThuA domain-containing protein [Actinomycetia bacterium]|nr:ThuA domain-containing protein [Actinomycetes bacterium]MCP5032682.1 ThuA domain-containing protein [Actinomycetes bacterium]
MATSESVLATVGVHLVVGGFPPGSGAAHDMDYVRLRLLEMLGDRPAARTSVANDFGDLDTWLATSRFLITYTAGPYPDADQNQSMRAWLEGGGRWLGLHGTSGGRAARIEGSRGRRMVRTPHHDTLGAFFLNHPPLRRFQVEVQVGDHELTRGVENFETADELYFIELTNPDDTEVLLTTELSADPAPGFGFSYDEDTSLLADGRSRALGITRSVGDGAVTYLALGHCHNPATNGQPWVDESVADGGVTPTTFRGSWETDGFTRLLANAIDWGISERPSAAP